MVDFMHAGINPNYNLVKPTIKMLWNLVFSICDSIFIFQSCIKIEIFKNKRLREIKLSVDWDIQEETGNKFKQTKKFDIN
jgi:hypothetical protein